jgi:hypothetical protein
VTEYRETAAKGDRFRGNPIAKGDQIQGKRSRAIGDRFRGILYAINRVTKYREKVRTTFAPFNKLMHHRCKHP